MADAFYLPLGEDRFRSTEHTVGPWNARDQHGGPPAALLGRAVERCTPRADAVVARVSVDLLGPVPVAEVVVRARLLRPGRAVELVEAELTGPDGRVAMRMTAWRIAGSPDTVERVPAALGPPPPVPAPQPEVFGPGWLPGYVQAVEWRWTEGHFTTPGPATVWTRLRHPLLPDEQPTGLQRVLAVADSGNGASNVLDLRDWLFINPELTVHLLRPAAGEWVCLRARTVVEPGGAGLATSVLYDERGEVGHGAQALLVRPR